MEQAGGVRAVLALAHVDLRLAETPPAAAPPAATAARLSGSTLGDPAPTPVAPALHSDAATTAAPGAAAALPPAPSATLASGGADGGASLPSAGAAGGEQAANGDAAATAPESATAASVDAAAAPPGAGQGSAAGATAAGGGDEADGGSTGTGGGAAAAGAEGSAAVASAGPAVAAAGPAAGGQDCVVFPLACYGAVEAALRKFRRNVLGRGSALPPSTLRVYRCAAALCDGSSAGKAATRRTHFSSALQGEGKDVSCTLVCAGARAGRRCCRQRRWTGSCCACRPPCAAPSCRSRCVACVHCVMVRSTLCARGQRCCSALRQALPARTRAVGQRELRLG